MWSGASVSVGLCEVVAQGLCEVVAQDPVCGAAGYSSLVTACF